MARVQRRSSASPRRREEIEEDAEVEDDEIEDEDDEIEDEDFEDEDDEDEEPPVARRRGGPAKPPSRVPPRRERPEPAPRSRGGSPEGASRSRRVKPETDSPVRVGWSGVDAVMAENSAFAARLNIEEEPHLIAFLEPEPFASFAQHWLTVQGQKRPFMCLTRSKGCPLCEAGDNPTSVVVFNVAQLDTGGPPANKVIYLGIRAMSQLRSVATGRGGPGSIDRGYWAVSKSGKASKPGSVAWNFRPLKERDIVEDEGWGDDVEPLDSGTRKELISGMYDFKVFSVPTRAQLREVVRTVFQEEDEDNDEVDELDDEEEEEESRPRRRTVSSSRRR